MSFQKNIEKDKKTKHSKQTYLKIFSLLKPYLIPFIIVLIFAILSTVFAIVGPKILGTATTELYEGLIRTITGTGEVDFAAIGKILITLIIIYGCSSLFSFIQGTLMAQVATKITYKLRNDIMGKVNRLPLSYFDKVSFGDVLSHITNDVDTISNSLSSSITSILTSFVTIVGILYMMFSINWIMAVVSLLVLPVSMLFVTFIVKHSQKQYRLQQNYLGSINGKIEEMYGNHLIVKAYNGETQAIDEFNGDNDILYSSAWKSQFFGGMMQPIMEFIGNLGYVIVSLLGGYLVTQGRIAIGDIQSFIQYMRSFTQPISQLANLSNVLQSTSAAGERIFAFLDEKEEDPDTVYPLSVENLKGSVSFAHVKFGYDPKNLIIHDFTAALKAGERVAIVGPTGAGKTTIVKLLMRFYDVTEGAILVDDLDIRQFQRNDIRSMFGMVLQDTWLYNATILDNIRYGQLNATDEQVYEAAKLAQADHFINTLPEGYGTLLNEESSNISQGQKQLLTIARAILAQPKILILDEATSSVDTRTEILIQKAMDTLMEGRTSFIIAHRLSTIRNADTILVMNHGDIVEQGNHETLLAQNGFYAQLYNSQFDEGEE